MSTKVTLTITPDTEYLGPNEIDAAMLRTITTLQRLGAVPLRKITLAIECKDEDAEELEDTIDAALSARPVGIEVVLKTTKERHVSRDTALPRVTPMDEVRGFNPHYSADHPINQPPVPYDVSDEDLERVRLSYGDRTVELTSQTARNAAQMLRDTPIGSDGPPRRSRA